MIAAALTNFVVYIWIHAESSNIIDSGLQRAKKERMLIIQNNLDNALQKWYYATSIFCLVWHLKIFVFGNEDYTCVE